MNRQVICVDVETNGLHPAVHDAVEVSWWNLDTGIRGTFIPPHLPSKVLAAADVRALRINRYIDRIAGQPQDTDLQELRRLQLQFVDWDEDQVSDDGDVEEIHNVLAGSNPGFDARFLTKLLSNHQLTEHAPAPWHHRLLDLSAYAAGVLGLDWADLPGLRTVCELLDIPGPDHTAAGDVHATGNCFLELRRRAAIAGITVPQPLGPRPELSNQP